MNKSNRDAVENLRKSRPKEILRCAVDLVLGTTVPMERSSQTEIETKIAEIVHLYKCPAGDPTLYTQVRDELQEIEKAAEKLIKCIERSNPLTMSRFRAGHLRGWFLQGTDTTDPLDDRMLADGRETKLVTFLRDVTHVARQDRKPDVWAIGSGKQAKYPEPEHAKRELVRDCVRLFEAHRPGEAKSTLNGDFLLFVGFVWELATGQAEVSLKTVALPILRQWRKMKKAAAEPEKTRSEVIETIQNERGKKLPGKLPYP